MRRRGHALGRCGFWRWALPAEPPGAFSRAWLAAKRRVAYVATSADPDQTDRLALTAQSFAGASAVTWSPRDGREALGEEAAFDVILAVNACARLQLDAASLSVLRDLLAPGGLLLGAEPEFNALWDVVFGQAAGWWEGGLRSAGHRRCAMAKTGAPSSRPPAFSSTGTAPCSSAPWPSAVFWGSAPSGIVAADDLSAEPRVVALIGGDTPLRRALLDRLEAAGHRTMAAPFLDFPLPADSPGDAPEVVLFLCAEPDADGSATQHLATLARLAHAAAERRSALWVVTCGAQHSTPADADSDAEADGDVGLVGAALWGFARVLMNELPRLRVRLVDLAPAALPGECAGQIAVELAADTPETEIVWTAHGRHVLRLRPGLPPRRAARSDLLTLASSRAGGFDALAWELRAPRILGPGEVEIDVHAAGLNFRDMMWAMGLLPEEALIDGFAGPSFGLECAGIVRAVGHGSKRLLASATGSAHLPRRR